jgi:hypothetical protein
LKAGTCTVYCVHGVLVDVRSCFCFGTISVVEVVSLVGGRVLSQGTVLAGCLGVRSLKIRYSFAL